MFPSNISGDKVLKVLGGVFFWENFLFTVFPTKTYCGYSLTNVLTEFPAT